MNELKLKSYKKSTIIKEGSDSKPSNKKTHYVDKALFYEALVERRKRVEAAELNYLDPPRVTDYIGQCLISIAKNLSMMYQFRSYIFREDMVSKAVVIMLKYIDSFDTNVSNNPFSYMTQTAYYSFIDTIKIEKRHLATKFRYALEKIALQDFSETDDESIILIAEENLPDTRFMNEYVKEYDKAIDKKKNKPALVNNLFDIADI